MAFALPVQDHVARHADDDRIVVLRAGRPGEHPQELLAAGGCQTYQIRDVGHHRDVERARMRVIGVGDAGAEHEQRGRRAVQGQLLLQLVVGALEERGRRGQHRTPAGLGDAGGEGDRMLLRDAGVHVVRAGTLAERPGDAVRPGGGGGDDDQARLRGEPLLQRPHRHLAVIFTCPGQAVGGGQRILPVVRLATALDEPGRRVFGVQPQSLERVHMQDDRMVDVLDLFEHLHERGHVVAVLDIAVVQPEGVEQIGFGGAARFAQSGQRSVHAAEVLGDRHLVVVDDDDQVAALFGGVVQPLEGDGRAERAVADDGDHVADAATVEAAHHVAGLGQTAGQRDRGAGVPEHELVVFALLGVRETGHLVIPVGIQIGLGAAGEHLVHVALVRDVEDDAVAGRVEDAVNRHGELDHPQVGPDMPPMGLAVGDERGTDIGAQLREFGGIQGFHIGRGSDSSQQFTVHAHAPSSDEYRRNCRRRCGKGCAAPGNVPEFSVSGGVWRVVPHGRAPCPHGPTPGRDSHLPQSIQTAGCGRVRRSFAAAWRSRRSRTMAGGTVRRCKECR